MLAAKRRREEVRIFLAAMMAAFQLAPCVGVHAHGDDKPKLGGIMGRGDDSVSIELLIAGERLRARITLPNGDEVSSVFLFK